MKINRIEPILVHEWLLVAVHTDNGLSGIGESAYWGHPKAAAQIIKEFEEYLIGKDPLNIEHHWQTLYKGTCFRGGALMGALSAIDIALWDLAGKHLEVPVYQLLGGKSRDKVRAMLILNGETSENLAEDAARAVNEGFTFVKIVPFPINHGRMYQANLRREIVERVAAVRETVGPDIDIGVEMHRRLNVGEAIAVATELEQFRPLFFEDPVSPESTLATGDVASKIRIPLATGERNCHVHEFRDLLACGGSQYVRPDIGYAGGFTACKKIASLAEAHEAGFIFHNFLGPVATAAAVQLDTCIPNFTAQEYVREDQPPWNDIVTACVKLENGYLIPPDVPGIGIELSDRSILDRYPFRSKNRIPPFKEDGSPTNA